MPRQLAAFAGALALLVVVGSTESARAHYPAPEEWPGTRVVTAAAAPVAEAPPPVLSAAPATTRSPWGLAAVAAAVALAWRRPRRATTFALVLLLALFAFENGVHSAHHDQGHAQSCAVAAVSAQLNGIAIDAVLLTDVILAAVSSAPETDRLDHATRHQSPDQGRAPPTTAA